MVHITTWKSEMAECCIVLCCVVVFISTCAVVAHSKMQGINKASSSLLDCRFDYSDEMKLL